MTSLTPLEQWEYILNEDRLLRMEVAPSEIERFLRENPGFDINVLFHSWSALHYAIICFNTVITAKLLELGATLDKGDARFYLQMVISDLPPSHRSVIQYEERNLRRLNIVRMILEQIKKFGRKDGISSLHEELNVAIEKNEIKFIQILIEAGVSVNDPKIRVEIKNVNLTTFECLLDYGFSPVKYTDGIGTSVLEQAFYANNQQFLKTIELHMHESLFKQKIKGIFETALATGQKLDPANPLVRKAETFYTDVQLAKLSRVTREKILYIRFCVSLCSLDFDHLTTVNMARTLCVNN